MLEVGSDSPCFPGGREELSSAAGDGERGVEEKEGVLAKLRDWNREIVRRVRQREQIILREVEGRRE